MAEQQSPTVEVAPTIIVSNSEEGSDNAAASGPAAASDVTNGGDEPASHNNGNAASGAEGLDADTGALSLAEQPGVAIAAIEAERDIGIAEIHASVERERIELEADRIEAIVESNGELEECRNRILTLEAQMEELRSLIPPPPQEATTETELLETAPEPHLIQPSTAAPMLETPMEALEESVAESPVEEVPNRRRKFIAI